MRSKAILATAAYAAAAALDRPQAIHGKSAHTIIVDDIDLAEAEPRLLADDIETQKAAYKALVESGVPLKLSSDPNHEDYHPSFMRVGVRIDGQERTDLAWYDVDKKAYKSGLKGSTIQQADSVEPYWRYPETRQQRRARERWEQKR